MVKPLAPRHGDVQDPCFLRRRRREEGEAPADARAHACMTYVRVLPETLAPGRTGVVDN
jgi:hypothetical protein